MASNERAGDVGRDFRLEFGAAVAEGRADGVAWAAKQAERRLWQATLGDSLT